MDPTTVRFSYLLANRPSTKLIQIGLADGTSLRGQSCPIGRQPHDHVRKECGCGSSLTDVLKKLDFTYPVALVILRRHPRLRPAGLFC